MGLPSLTGPYPIGTTIQHFTDSSRPEPYTDDPTDTREILVQFWYPAQAVAGAEPAPYCPDCDLLLPLLSRRNPPPVIDELITWRARAVPDAPLATAPAQFPIVTLSHGLGAPRMAHTAQAEELASHGYVVAAIEHSYGSHATRLPDGRVFSFISFFPGLERIRLQAADVRFVVDRVEHLQSGDPGGLFTGRLETKRVGMMGHSFGGATAALACRLDTRCAGGVVYDSEVLTETYQDGPPTPLLVMNSSRFSANNSQLLERWSGDAYRLVVEGTIHNDFFDAPLWPYAAERAGGAIQPERGFRVISTYTLAFFDTYLKGQHSPLLEGPSSNYPEVRIEVRHN